jgi:hypothetical protein
MPLNDFRSVFLPYCLRKQPDGRYVVVNREYKPIGFCTTAYVDYTQFPVAASLKGVTAALARKLSHDGNPGIDEIYLYDDGCVPTSSAAHMSAYLAKLQLLAKLKISPPSPGA